MAGNILLNLVENIQSWDKLENRIADLPTEMERGNVFEEFKPLPFDGLPLEEVINIDR